MANSKENLVQLCTHIHASPVLYRDSRLNSLPLAYLYDINIIAKKLRIYAQLDRSTYSPRFSIFVSFQVHIGKSKNEKFPCIFSYKNIF